MAAQSEESNQAASEAAAHDDNGAKAATQAAGAAAKSPAVTKAAGGVGKPPAASKLVLTKDQLDDRLERARRAALAKALGSDDVEALKAKLKRAEELEKEAEKARLERMSEIERAKEEARLAKARADAVTRALEAERERRMVEIQDRGVTRLAMRYINPRYVTEAKLAFARAVRQMGAEKAATLDDAAAARWFAKYAAERKEIAAAARKASRRPAGAANQAPRPPSGQSAGTTSAAARFSPTGPNALSARDARREAAKLGYRW